MDRLTLLQNFVQVVESRSFSAAAEALGSTQSQVSKLVRALEDQIKVSLFIRTTRSLSLTEEGQRFLPQAKAVLDSYATATEVARGDHAEPRGHIRFLTSDGLGRYLFLPYLPTFLRRYPFISVEHIVTNRKIDLVENNIDLALRMGELKDSSVKSKRVGLARRITVASPEYLKAKGIPRTPEDLANHNCVLFTRLGDYTGTGFRWVYHEPKTGAPIEVAVSGTYASDNSSTVRQVALEGVGIYQGPSFLFGEDIQSGRLNEILADYSMNPYPIYIIYPAAEFIPLRVKAMINFLSKEFALNPWVAG